MKRPNNTKIYTTIALLPMLLITSCSHDLDSYYVGNKINEYVQCWKDSIGGNIDPNHTWNTTREAQLTVTTNKSGTLRILTRSAFNGTEGRVTLMSKDVEEGETVSCTIAIPQNIDTLYSALYDADGFIDERVLVVEGNTATANYSNLAAKLVMKSKPAVRSYNGNYWQFTDVSTLGTPATSVPSNAVHSHEGKPGIYYIEPGDSYINYYEGASTIYIKSGNYELSTSGIYPGSTVYLLPGANVKIKDSNFYNQSNSKIFIAEGATLDISMIGSSSQIASKVVCYGEFIGSSNMELQLGNNALLYLNPKAKTTLNNVVLNPGSGNDAELIVDGELNVTHSLKVQSCGHFHNSGTTTVGGDTQVDYGVASWINDGTYTTKNFKLECGGLDVINNCRLTVTNTFDVKLGDNSQRNGFYLNANSSVTTKDLKLTTGTINMGANSLFEVTGMYYTFNTKPEYGFYGPTSGEALLKAKTVKLANNATYQKYGVCYHNNLIVASNNHFAEVATNDGNYPMIYKEGNVKMYNKADSAPVVIPSYGNCNPGYNGGGGDPEPEDPEMWYYYAFEDLGSIGDFDFNDVVIRASSPSNGIGKLQLCAAGGTMRTTIYLNGTALGKDGKTEVHELFGVSTNTMVNTQNRTEKQYVDIGTYEGGNPATLNILVQVQDKGHSCTISATNYSDSELPLSLTISGSPTNGLWNWPYERQRIDNAFKDFSKWVENEDYNIDWYK